MSSVAARSMSGKDISSPDFWLTHVSPIPAELQPSVVIQAGKNATPLLARLKVRTHGYDLVSGDFSGAEMAASLSMDRPLSVLRKFSQSKIVTGNQKHLWLPLPGIESGKAL